MQAGEDAIREQTRMVEAAREAARQQRAAGAAGGLRVREALDLFAARTERLVGAAGGLRRAWAAALAAEGLTRREVGTRLGVSHQRVSALLGPDSDPSRCGTVVVHHPAAPARSGV